MQINGGGRGKAHDCFMVALAARIILIVAGALATLFVADNAANFSVVQMTIALVLFGLVMLGAAFWPWSGIGRPPG